MYFRVYGNFLFQCVHHLAYAVSFNIHLTNFMLYISVLLMTLYSSYMCIE